MPRVSAGVANARLKDIQFVDFDAVYKVIYDTCMKVVDAEMERGYQVALDKVPVRKVFAGGRTTKPVMSIAQLKAETPSFLSLFTPSERAQRFHGPRGGRVRAGSYPIERVGVRTVTHLNRYGHVLTPSKDIAHWKDMPAERQLNLVSEADWDRARKEHRLPPAPAGASGQAMRYRPARFRLVDIGQESQLVPGTGYLAWAHGNNDALLNAEGRKVLRMARIEKHGLSYVDVGRGGIAWSDTGGFTLGGTLRNSIKIVERGMGGKYAYLQAGGGRAYYAQYMEFGTRHVAARPFMRPALAKMEREFWNRLMSALKKIEKRNPITI